MTRRPVWAAWEAFHGASEARRSDVHDPVKSAALKDAKDVLEHQVAAALDRVPYRARAVADLRPGRDGGRVHLAVDREIAIGGWSRSVGQALCGEPAGRPAPRRPVTCAACLRLLDRHIDLEPDPPELPLF